MGSRLAPERDKSQHNVNDGAVTKRHDTISQVACACGKCLTTAGTICVGGTFVSWPRPPLWLGFVALRASGPHTLCYLRRVACSGGGERGVCACSFSDVRQLESHERGQQKSRALFAARPLSAPVCWFLLAWPDQRARDDRPPISALGVPLVGFPQLQYQLSNGKADLPWGPSKLCGLHLRRFQKTLAYVSKRASIKRSDSKYQR